MKQSQWIYSVIVVLVAAGAYLLWQDYHSDDELASLVAPEVAPVAVVEEAESMSHKASSRDAEAQEALLPAPSGLDESDAFVESLVNAVAPEFIQWLVPDEQVRKAVTAIDMMAEGQYPRKYPVIVFPHTAFQVVSGGEGEEDLKYANLANTNRADSLIAALKRVDPALLARYYRQWRPTLEQAYGELGKTDRFSDRFETALDRLIAVESPPADAALVQPHVFYQYQDPELEQRSDLDKLVWRLGDENQRALQEFLRQFKQEL